MAYWITESKVRAILSKLEIDLSDWESAEIKSIIALQQKIFLKYVGRSIEQTDRTDRVDGSGLASLVAPDYPIISITKVSIVSYTAETYAEADLLVEKATGLIWLETVRMQDDELLWPKGTRNIEIQATYGYATIPEEILEALPLACAAQILVMEESRMDGSSIMPGLQSFRIGNYSETYGRGGPYRTTIEKWDALIKQVADLHKNVRIV